MSTEVKGRKYTVEILDGSKNPLLRADLIARGFDGNNYILRGVRSAVYFALRCSATGQFIIC